MHRRNFLAALGCLALPLPALGNGTPPTTLLAAAADGDGPLFTTLADTPAPPLLRTPTRGHGMVALPGGRELILVARRPGYWMWRIDWRDGRVLAATAAAAERHFFGHALLAPDGRTLYATENDIASGRGVVGVYDAASLARLGELPSHGIGPHELLWLEPGKVLAVANGGILTLPETGRLKLNLERMEPSVVLLEMPGGRVLGEHVLADRSLSLRHLARSADGTLGIAIQAESPDGRSVADAPLLAILRDGALRLAEAPPALGGYAASVAACGDVFVATALQGDTVVAWHSDGRLLHELGLRRPAGIAVHGESVLVSNELGRIVRIDPARGSLEPVAEHPGVRWDNHLVVAG